MIAISAADWAPPRSESGSVDRPLYALEADTFAEAVAAGQQEVPAMPWADTLGNLRTLDRWRASLGLVYPGE